MKKFFLIGVTLCAVAAASPRARVLNYYSTGEPLQHALDYAFGSFGLRFTAPPEVLAAPWYGEFSGSVTGDALPHYVASVLRPMGLIVERDAMGVYQITAQNSELVELRDTLLVLDSVALARLGEWCNMPNCTFALMPSPGSVLLRFRPGFADFVRRVSEVAAPLAVEDVPPVQISMIIYRHNADSTRTIGLEYPAKYLPVPDLLHQINLYEESGEIDITARPRFHVRPGGKYELFFGSERPYQRSTLQESGAVTLDTEYRKYGLTLAVDYSDVKDGRHSFAVRLSSSSYNEDGTNVLSETRTEVTLPLDSALVVAAVDAENVVQRRRGVPYLCDLPLIGRLFGTFIDVHEKTAYNVVFWINAEGRAASNPYTPAAKKE